MEEKQKDHSPPLNKGGDCVANAIGGCYFLRKSEKNNYIVIKLDLLEKNDGYSFILMNE